MDSHKLLYHLTIYRVDILGKAKEKNDLLLTEY